MAENDKTIKRSRENKKRFPLKALLILVGVLGLEVATVLIVFALKPAPAHVVAEAALEGPEVNLEQPIEELLIEEKFSNLLRGETIIYDTQIYITIRRKHQELARTQIDTKQARISTDVAMIIARAQPAHFAEPTRATLTRQIKAAVDKRLGVDSDSQPIVEEVLVTKLIPYKADH